ncbi:hypothetical protein [Nostoc sp. TCL240-02]|uniref:hypothetical protein n=1 Tax=Nostoc sp. TCL240-02 TaxID=2572090 RepID=UPI00157F95CF|nr:hypothetical protein [Nostoc sp. TCL240-02]QKQ73378.1 hypothetical protein FBB35_08410 [Nostoc sp. TCL240-02]
MRAFPDFCTRFCHKWQTNGSYYGCGEFLRGDPTLKIGVCKLNDLLESAFVVLVRSPPAGASAIAVLAKCRDWAYSQAVLGQSSAKTMSS